MRTAHPVERSTRRIILHVGPTKTATTTIQTALALGGDFIYPVAGPGSGHSDLARRALGLRNAVAEPELLVELASGIDRESPAGMPIVISAEGFSYVLSRVARAEALRRLARRFPTEVVLTIRRDDERIDALAAQVIFEGAPLDPETYWMTMMGRPDLQPNIVRRFLGVAPWSSAHVVRVDPSDPDHLFTSFERIVGVPIQRVDPTNTRWSPKALAVMNELNHVQDPAVPLGKRRGIARRGAQMITDTSPAVLRYGLRPVPEQVRALVKERWFVELEEIRGLDKLGRLRLHDPFSDASRQPPAPDGASSPSGRPARSERGTKAAPSNRRGSRTPSREAPVTAGGPREDRSHQLILHVGPPKTGTSALQVFLAQNSEAIQRLGLQYPRLDGFDAGVRGRVGSGNGYTLAGLMTGLASASGPDLAARTDGLTRILVGSKVVNSVGSGPVDVLMSSEYLTRPTTDDLVAFRSIAASEFIGVRAITVHRDPVELLCSAHEQAVKSEPRLQQTLDEFWASSGCEVLTQRLRTPIRYADALGDDAVAVISYSGPSGPGHPLILDFLVAASGRERGEVDEFLASEDVVLPSRPVNRSLGPIGRELVRLCNVNGVDRRTVRRLYSEIDSAAPSKVTDLLTISKEFRTEVLASTIDTIQELRSRFDIDGMASLQLEDSVLIENDAIDETQASPMEELTWVLEGVSRVLARRRSADRFRFIRAVRRRATFQRLGDFLPRRTRSALNRALDRSF